MQLPRLLLCICLLCRLKIEQGRTLHGELEPPGLGGHKAGMSPAEELAKEEEEEREQVSVHGSAKLARASATEKHHHHHQQHSHSPKQLPTPREQFSFFSSGVPANQVDPEPSQWQPPAQGHLPTVATNSSNIHLSNLHGVRPLAPGEPSRPSEIASSMTSLVSNGLNFILQMFFFSFKAMFSGVSKMLAASPMESAEKKNPLGMLEYLGPFGYDPYGPGTSFDGYGMQTPETNNCHQLLQTWMRQCASAPEYVGKFLQVEVETTPLQPAAPAFLEQQSSPSIPPQLMSMLASLGSQGSNAGDGLPKGGPRPNSPLFARAPAAPSMPAGKGLGEILGSNAGMMGLGTYQQGPDLYDPTGPYGTEPHPDGGSSGPEKCYRLLQSWLYKCSLSPL